MINSAIISVYTMPPNEFAVILETTSGFYHIVSNGFYKVDDLLKVKSYKRIDYPVIEGQKMVSVKSDLEYVVIKLLNGSYLVYHVDTPFLDIISKNAASSDPQFIQWVENEMEELTNNRTLC